MVCAGVEVGNLAGDGLEKSLTAFDPRKFIALLILGRDVFYFLSV
jgi:hypothetical protein